MKLTEDDIEIIQKPPTKRERMRAAEKESDIDETKRAVVHWNPSNNCTMWGYQDVKKPFFDGDAFIQSLYDQKHCIWSDYTRTGIGRYFTEEYARSLVLLHGTPKFPITIGDDGLPVLDKVYDDMWIISTLEEYNEYLSS